MSDLPPGFLLDSSSPGLPQGFVLDGAPKAQERGVVDKLLGLTGERYQTWPEKLVRSIGQSAVSAATLPHDVMTGQASPDDTARVMDLAALAAPVNPAVRAGDAAIPGVAKTLVPGKVAVPTTQELAAAGGADISAATKSDLIIPSSAIADFSRLIQQKIGVHPVDAEKTFAKLKELENPPAGSYFTPADLQALRGSLQDTAQNFNPNAAKDQLAATRAIRELDTFLPGLGPKDTVVRPAAAESAPATREQIVAQALAGQREAQRVADLFERGRGNYAAAMRSNNLTGELDRANTGILERAETRAQAANSGRNLDNTIRQKVASLLEKPKEVSGYSDEELAALNDVVAGGGVRNTSRYVGNLLGGGGGLGQSVMTGLGAAGGASVGGVPGAIAGAAAPASIGAVAKALANRLAKRSLSSADELVRKRSPLYQEAVEATPMTADGLAQREAIARLLLMQMNPQPQQ